LNRFVYLLKLSFKNAKTTPFKVGVVWLSAVFAILCAYFALSLPALVTEYFAHKNSAQYASCEIVIEADVFRDANIFSVRTLKEAEREGTLKVYDFLKTKGYADVTAYESRAVDIYVGDYQNFSGLYPELPPFFAENGIIVSNRFAKCFDCREGDTVTLSGIGVQGDFHIEKILSGNLFYETDFTFNVFIGGTPANYFRNYALVKAKSGDGDALYEKLKSHPDFANALVTNVSGISGKEIAVKNVTVAFSVAVAFTLLFAVLFTVVAILILLKTRRGLISSYRAAGALRREIFAALAFEACGILAAALPVSFLSALLLTGSVRSGFGVTGEPLPLLWEFAAAFLIAAASVIGYYLFAAFRKENSPRGKPFSKRRLTAALILSGALIAAVCLQELLETAPFLIVITGILIGGISLFTDGVIAALSKGMSAAARRRSPRMHLSLRRFSNSSVDKKLTLLFAFAVTAVFLLNGAIDGIEALDVKNIGFSDYGIVAVGSSEFSADGIEELLKSKGIETRSADAAFVFQSEGGNRADFFCAIDTSSANTDKITSFDVHALKADQILVGEKLKYVDKIKVGDAYPVTYNGVTVYFEVAGFISASDSVFGFQLLDLRGFLEAFGETRDYNAILIGADPKNIDAVRAALSPETDLLVMEAERIYEEYTGDFIGIVGLARFVLRLLQFLCFAALLSCFALYRGEREEFLRICELSGMCRIERKTLVLTENAAIAIVGTVIGLLLTLLLNRQILWFSILQGLFIKMPYSFSSYFLIAALFAAAIGLNAASFILLSVKKDRRY
jgi:hypothetical protein